MMKHSQALFLLLTALLFLTPESMEAQRESIAPLMKSEWGQGAPYNCLCPKLGNGAAPQTGCNATAAAQIVRYHQHAKGEYDFSLMPLKMKGVAYSDAEAQEIGRLMRDLGAAMQMQYGEGESISGVTSSVQALTSQFGYDKSVQILRREYFTDAEWEDIIYAELKAGRPVIYTGQRSSGVHCFVIHGYDAEKKQYAVNWGWEGYCDGYVPLTGPGALVSGAYGNEGYTEDQIAYINVRPDEGGKELLMMGTRGTYLFNGLANDSHYQNRDVNLSGSKKTYYVMIAYYNVSLSDLSGLQCGVMLREKTSGKAYYTESLNTVSLGSGKYQTSRMSLKFSTSLIPYNGVYEVLPVVRRYGSEWVRVMLPAGQVPSTITCTGGIDDPTSGVVVPEAEELSHDDKIEQILTPDGKVITNLQPGINIVKTRTGKIRKVFLPKK